MTTIKAMRLASVVTAIDVLVASGFSIVGISRPQYLVPAGSRCGRSTSRRHLRWCSWVRSPAPCNCLMPESVSLSVILGNALDRFLSLSSNSSWCIYSTDPRITTQTKRG